MSYPSHLFDYFLLNSDGLLLDWYYHSLYGAVHYILCWQVITTQLVSLAIYIVVTHLMLSFSQHVYCVSMVNVNVLYSNPVLYKATQ